MSTYTGDQIRKCRTEKGLTQKKLGELCGIADSNIRKYESGNQNPKIETLQKIANVLEIPVSNLLEPSVFHLSNDIIELFAEKGGLEIDTRGTRLNKLFYELNITGQDKAIEQVELLTKIPEYQKDSDQE